MMRKDTQLVHLFLEKSLIAKTQVAFINDNINKMHDHLAKHLKQTSIVDPFYSEKNKSSATKNIPLPHHLIKNDAITANDFNNKIASEMYCNLSVVLFDHLIGYLNQIIKFCNQLNPEDVDFALYGYQNEILINTKDEVVYDSILTKKKIVNPEENLSPIDCFGIIKNLFEIEFILFDELMITNLAKINCIKFFYKMEKFREFIVYHGSMIPKKYKNVISYYSYQEINGSEDLKLTLTKSETEHLIAIYNQTIYIIYKALITKYNLDNQIKRATINEFDDNNFTV